jgi:hypothetical protein
MGKKTANAIACHVCYQQPVIRLFVVLRGEWHQQAESITVAALRVARQVTFDDQMLHEKPTHPRAE